MAKAVWINRLPGAKRDIDQRISKGLKRLSTNVINGATHRTPMKSGKLRQEVSVGPVLNNTTRIKWGARYAAVQNQGKRRGARPFHRYTTPGTGAGFVQTGVEYARKRIGECFK